MEATGSSACVIEKVQLCQLHILLKLNILGGAEDKAVRRCFAEIIIPGMHLDVHPLWHSGAPKVSQ